jgi:hypothetical protein
MSADGDMNRRAVMPFGTASSNPLFGGAALMIVTR